MLATIITRIGAGLRWLARQTYRQRSLGVAGSPQLARLLDLHAITVAAHFALGAALLLAHPVHTAVWAVALVGGLALTAMAVWRSGRVFVGLLIVAQAVLALLTIRWPFFLPYLVAVAVSQQACVFAVWIRNGASLAVLGRATAYGSLLGVFTGFGGLVLGVFARSIPLWTAAVLFVIASFLALRLPDTGQGPPRPRQGGGRKKNQIPEGYAVYRPSSLDPRRDAA